MDNASTPDDSQDLRSLIIELEHKLAFQQRAFDELNAVVLKQQTEIDSIHRESLSLRQQLQNLRDRGNEEDLPHEKPPHY